MVAPVRLASAGIMCSAEPTIKEPDTEALEYGQNMIQEAIGATYRHFAGSSDIRIHSDSLQALKPLIRAQSDLSPQEGLSAYRTTENPLS